MPDSFDNTLPDSYAQEAKEKFSKPALVEAKGIEEHPKDVSVTRRFVAAANKAGLDFLKQKGRLSETQYTDIQKELPLKDDKDIYLITFEGKDVAQAKPVRAFSGNVVELWDSVVVWRQRMYVEKTLSLSGNTHVHPAEPDTLKLNNYVPDAADAHSFLGYIDAKHYEKNETLSENLQRARMQADNPAHQPGKGYDTSPNVNLPAPIRDPAIEK